jgi:hypothetical protein
LAVRLRWVVLATVAAAVLLLMMSVATGASTKAQKVQNADASTTATETTETTTSTIQPDPPSVLQRESTTSPEESATLEQRLQKQRDTLDAANAKRYPGGAESDAPEGRPTNVAAESEALLVRKNRRNSVATSVSNTLAEPAAASDGRQVVYAGNTYQSRTIMKNPPTPWVNLGAYPGGPTDAPSVCCDPDVVHASPTDTTFNVILYTNSALTNGAVRIFVRRGIIKDGIDCTYTIDPGGTSDNILPDYPHINVSNNFLYLTTNNIQNGTTWVGAQTRRFNLSQMSNCQSTTTDTFTFSDNTIGQRVHVPVENATTTMFWGQHDNATTFRIFSWPESTTSVSQTTRSVASSTFDNPDCRGGTGDFDWIERSTAWSITGFRMRGATGGGLVQFLWNAAPDTQHTQAHLHGAVFRTSDLALQAEPPVFNNSICFGFPALGSNQFGEYALSFGAGGDNIANSGTSQQGAVAVDDGSSTGFFFPTFQTTATGTHNRSDGRFGDYFTVHNNERCANTWNATNYALLNGNTAASHVNARYVEFQSNSDPSCPA